MRSFVCLALVLAAALVATPCDAQAGDAPLARVQHVQEAALDMTAGAGAAIAPRINLAAPTSVSFGFQGPVARITPPRPVVAPSVFRGFGGFAAQLGSCGCDGCAEPAVADDVSAEGDVVAYETDADEVLEGKVDACGRLYTERVPTEVNHQSSYYVPRYRSYVRSSCGSSCDPCCDPCTTRRYVVVRRPVYSCYRPCYRPCYRSCYSGCGAPFWGGFGWGLGWGLGVGLAYGCW